MLIKDSRGGRIIFRDRLGVVDDGAAYRFGTELLFNRYHFLPNIHVVPGNWESEELTLGIYCLKIQIASDIPDH